MKKTVLITGANHGLGLSLVKEFLSHDYIVFAGVYKLTPESQIQDIKDNDDLHIINMDVSDLKSVEEAAGYVRGITQKLDILINNAGILCKDSYDKKHYNVFETLDFDSMKTAYDVNALGALRVANVFSSMLMDGEYKLLINISSEAGSIGACTVSDWHGYRMSKAAMNMAGALIHNAYVKQGGMVWQIHPGWMQTYMHGDRYDIAELTPEYSAEQIYKMVLDAGAYKTGKPVYMDIDGTPWPW